MVQAQTMRACEFVPPIGAGVKWDQTKPNQYETLCVATQPIGALFSWHPWMKGLKAKIFSR